MSTAQPPTTKGDAPQSMQRDYEEWRAMGEGGTSPTWEGYLSSINMEKTIAFTDTLSLDMYDKPDMYATGWSKSAAWRESAITSYLTEPLPLREEPRARAKRYVFPQRERNAADPLDQGIKEAYQLRFQQLGIDAAASTEWHTSVLEKQGTALFLNPKILLSPLAAPSEGEICHLHTSDMSGHVTLSFADAKEVIRKGWGERHRLSGTEWIHLGYTMLYVPRSIEEVEVFGRILQAGVDFMRSGTLNSIMGESSDEDPDVADPGGL